MTFIKVIQKCFLFLFASASKNCVPKNRRPVFSTPLFRIALPLPRMHTGALKRANIGIISRFTKAISLIYKLLHEIAFFHPLQKEKMPVLDRADIFCRTLRKGTPANRTISASRLLCDRPVHSFTMPEACLAGIPHFRQIRRSRGCRHTTTLFTIAHPTTRCSIPVWESSLAADPSQHTGAAPSERSP